MARKAGKQWFIDYGEERSKTRLLISLPVPMLMDLHAAAKLQGISAAELVRRAATRQLADLARSSALELQGKRKRV